MEKPIKMDDLVGKPPIFGNTHLLVGSLLTIDPCISLMSFLVGEVAKGNSKKHPTSTSWVFQTARGPVQMFSLHKSSHMKCILYEIYR